MAKNKKGQINKRKGKQWPTFIQTITVKDILQVFLVDTHNAQLKPVTNMPSGSPSIRQQAQD